MVLDYNRFKSKTRIKVQLKSIKIESWSNFNPFKFDFDPPWIKIHVGTFLTEVRGLAEGEAGSANSGGVGVDAAGGEIEGEAVCVCGRKRS